MDVRRVVEVWNPTGKCSGTGYLVAERLVLTALHNVLGRGVLEVRRLGSEELTWATAEVLWPEIPPDLEREPQADGALIRITDPGWRPPPGGEPVRWGRIDGSVVRDERLGCVAVGFPRAEARDGVRDTKEIRGHIETLTGLKSIGLITAYVDGVAVPSRPDERSRWAGASGAALFARGRLIGVVTTDRQRDYDADQLTAVSVVSLAARPGFAIAVKAAGGELVPEDITAVEPGRSRTAYDVDVPRGVNNLPEPPSPIFVGRAEAMAELERALAADSQTITQTVHGLGGVGKTTLALHYAHDHAGAYRLVWWIRADTPELIEAGFAALTLRLRGGEGADLTTAQAAEWAVGWLQTHPGWLLVFDNAAKPEDVHVWTGQLRASGRHLITSRYKRGWVCDPIALPVLDEEASLTLLSRLGGADDEDEARALADDLGHLPLALEQAGAFIAQTGITIAEYRDMLRRRPERTTDAAPGGSDPARTVARIWRITLDALQERDPRAVDILQIAAWYAPTGIPRALFAPLAEDPIDLAQLLGLLADYNMITLDRAGVGVHRLVQTVARTASEPGGDPHRDQARITAAYDLAAKLMLDKLPGDAAFGVAGWPTWRVLLPHVEALVDTEAPEDPGVDTAEINLILRQAGQFLLEQGKVSQATGYYSRSLAAASRMLGEDHPYTLGSRNNLAYAYMAAGDLGRAIPLFERTLEASVRVLGEDHPDTLRARNNLAGAYEKAGDARRAIPMWERTLEDFARVSGEDHPYTLSSRINLAGAYMAVGELGRAVPLFERTLEDSLRVLGEDHPYTLASRNNLAYAYMEAGDAGRVIPLWERTLEDSARVLGADHPTTLVSANNLAGAYMMVGDLGRAIPMWERTLADRVRVLGEDHPETLSSGSNLAGAYRLAGDLGRAIRLYEQTLADCLRVLGEDHPTTRNVRELLSVARAQEP
ncbi:tetratricopeptide repeat protein [Streptomyces sp. V4I2]|uniref:tetratricopeptide repeat protein n=1 Tax=Streptomyces sp. V4I2 TaxID=3042280 RepID=UPI00278271AD|nr:tetratricopeptide repeat protein [Streptomyces sp. V4I2]MDQ1047314.1 tetratricopeptide (TPR) repeat protein [Streptomyces sp. V4I2]